MSSTHHTGWGLSQDFLQELKERQDLIHREPDTGASALWLGLPLWLLGSSIYTFHALADAVVGLLL
ncbi:hypothetical protein GGP85_002898 [Salinibacter ruber]|uniref:hypothetical protein n=1 Tax=Salinibacter ruber TaxID=146919 RepID=UPI0021677CA4|nr:hypothetical protein [Salinibacter ruber]MCS3827428.1 hypothetical protein [Salinibacter ruber]